MEFVESRNGVGMTKSILTSSSEEEMYLFYDLINLSIDVRVPCTRRKNTLSTWIPVND
jgi:hypothetical protein